MPVQSSEPPRVVNHPRALSFTMTTVTRDSLIRHLPIRDVEDAGEMLGVSSRTVRRLAARGTLASHRVGNSLRFSESDLFDYIRRSRSDVVT